MTEAMLQLAVVNLCKTWGIWTLTIPDSTQVRKGWVDVVIIGENGAYFAELKSEDGRRSLDQIKVASRLTAAGLQYRLWRPSDWPDIIHDELEKIR